MAASGQNENNPILNNTENKHDSFILMSYLDEVEDRIEELRRKALSLKQEKDSLVTILSQLKDDRFQYSLSGDESSEILTSIEHLKKRCENVEINIRTSRTPEQESSYILVNSLVSQLENLCQVSTADSATFIHQAKGYLNACVSDGISQGPIDYKFQGMILGCKLEDQKLVRHRLESLVRGSCFTDFTEVKFQYHREATEEVLRGERFSQQEYSTDVNESTGVKTNDKACSP